MTLERTVVKSLASVLGEKTETHSIATETFGGNSDAVSVRKVVCLLFVNCARDANSVRYVLTNPLKHGRAT